VNPGYEAHKIEKEKKGKVFVKIRSFSNDLISLFNAVRGEDMKLQTARFR